MPQWAESQDGVGENVLKIYSKQSMVGVGVHLARGENFVAGFNPARPFAAISDG